MSAKEAAKHGTLEAMLSAYVEDVIDPTVAIKHPDDQGLAKLSAMMDFVGGAMACLTLLRELNERPHPPPVLHLLEKLKAECFQLHERLNPDLYRKKDG